MLSVKCGRKEFNLSEKDVIMYNGSCYQIITQETGAWGGVSPIIAKTKAEKLIKENKLKQVKSKKAEGLKDTNLLYYKINEEA